MTSFTSSSEMPASVRYHLTALAAGLVVVLLLSAFARAWYSPSREGSAAIQDRVRLSQERPDVFFMGNSMLGRGIDIDLMQERLGRPVKMYYGPGSGVAHWYVYFKNVVGAAQPPPPVVVLFFRDYELTNVQYGLDPQYLKEMRRYMIGPEAEVEEIAIRRLRHPFDNWLDDHWTLYKLRETARPETEEAIKDAVVPVLSVHDEKTMESAFRRTFRIDFRRDRDLQIADEDTERDFATALAGSFLPMLLETAREKNVQLILVRVRRRAALTSSQDPALEKYTEDLKDLLKEYSIPIIDLRNERRIRPEHFSDGDHMNGSGKKLQTRIVAERLSPLLPPLAAANP